MSIHDLIVLSNKVEELEAKLAAKDAEIARELPRREYKAYLGVLRIAELLTKEEFLDYMNRIVEQAREALAGEGKE